MRTLSLLLLVACARPALGPGVLDEARLKRELFPGDSPAELTWKPVGDRRAVVRVGDHLVLVELAGGGLRQLDRIRVDPSIEVWFEQAWERSFPTEHVVVATFAFPSEVGEDGETTPPSEASRAYWLGNGKLEELASWGDTSYEGGGEECGTSTSTTISTEPGAAGAPPTVVLDTVKSGTVFANRPEDCGEADCPDNMGCFPVHEERIERLTWTGNGYRRTEEIVPDEE